MKTVAHLFAGLSLGSIAFLWAFSSQAQIIVGNGGDVIACSADAAPALKNRTVLLDRYEAEEINGMTIDLGEGGDGDSYGPMLERVFERVERFDSSFASILRVYVDDFVDNARFLDDSGLVDVNDSRHVIIPHGCEVRQIAIQREPRFSGEPRYLIDENLFHQLELTDRAMLALHEALYRMALGSGQVNSLNVRYITGWLSTKEFDRVVNAESFRMTMTRAGFLTEFWLDSRLGNYWGLFECRVPGNRLHFIPR